MKARALVIDLFAEYVRHRDAQATALTITRLAEPFGVAEPTTRVTISRMRKEGWLESRHEGRLSYYAATEKLTALIEGSQNRILERRAWEWDGLWDMVVYTIPEASRLRRDHLRSKLEWLGYGQFAPSCWMTPHRRNTEVSRSLDPIHRFEPDEIELLQVTSGGDERDRSIADRCWRLDELQRDYRDFAARKQARLRDLETGSISDADAFVERVLLVAEYRKFPFRDPELPAALLPDDWVGGSAHSTFLELREALRVPAFRHYDTSTADGRAAPRSLPIS